MAAGETIHTENSHKYGLRGARLLLLAGGWTPSPIIAMPTTGLRSYWLRQNHTTARRRF